MPHTGDEPHLPTRVSSVIEARWTTKMKQATKELSLMPMMVSNAKAASCTTENSMMLMSPVKAVM